MSWLVLVLIISIGGASAQMIEISDVTIDCDPSGVEITVNSSALEEALPGVDLDRIRIGSDPNSPRCQAIISEQNPTGRGMKTFKFKYGECGPQVEDLTDTQLRLVYHILGDNKETGDVSGTQVSCFLSKDGLISAKIAENTKVYEYVGNNEGRIRFDVTIYRDSFMTTPVENDDEIPLGTPLWVKIKMFHSGDSELFVKDCWATPGPGTHPDQPEHVFIKKGIIGDDDETFAPVDDVITATSYGFSFDSFLFRGSGSRVYIKCNIHACHPRDADSSQDVCSIPKYPEYQVSARDLGELGSGSGSGYGMTMESRDLGDESEAGAEDKNQYGGDEQVDERELMNEMLDDDNILTDGVLQTEHPVYYVMHSFNVKHVERKRRSAGSYRIYPRHTMFSNLRSGITLGIIIASTAMLSACAILLPLHLSGEKVRCLHMKAVKRTI